MDGERWLSGLASCLCLGLHLLPVSAAVAQSEAPFRDAVDVEVVEIDVHAADRKGRPVRGLKREDFELVVDGRPVEISNFGESPVPVGPGEPTEWVTSDPGRESAGSGTGQAQGGAAAPLTLVLYLDAANTRMADHARLLSRLEQAVERWRRLNARFVLAAFEDRLEILVPPTRDLDALLQAAVNRLERRRVGARPDHARQQAIRDLVLSDESCAASGFCRPCVDNWGDLMGIARAFAAGEESRGAVAADGLADLVSTLAGVAGRKAVVHVSSGLQQQPGLSVFTYLVEQICPAVNSEVTRNTMDASSAMMSSGAASRFNAVSAHANANRVTFLALDAGGLRAPSTNIAGMMSGRTALGGRRLPSPENDRLYAANLQSGLFLLANETGGRALFNSNDTAELFGEIAEEITSGYSVGFLLPGHRPGQVLQVEVRLARDAAKGARLRYRRSVVAKTLGQRLAERLLSAAYLGGDENPLGASLRFVPSEVPEVPERDGRKKAHELIVGVAVPESSVTRVPVTGGREQGRLRLWMLAVDKDGGARTTVRQTVTPVGGGGVPATSGAYRFEVGIELPEGAYEIAVGVRDETTGVVSLLRDAVTTPLLPRR